MPYWLKTFTVLDIERALGMRSFTKFLEFVKIIEPPSATSRGGVIEFEMWDHIKEAAMLLAGKGDQMVPEDTPPSDEYIPQKRLLNVLKSRQLGWSWILAAYAVWLAQFKQGANILVFSQGQLESVAFLNKCKTIHENLPKHMKNPIGRSNDTLMAFKGMKSKITALPSTENAGRGETASLVIQDEADFHENLDLNYAAIKPTIDAGGQLVQVSTVNKKKAGTLFKEIHRGAPQNNFFSVFHGWKSRPDRDQAWYERVKAEAPTSDGMSPELYMEQEHPATAAEALAPSRVMAAFDVDAIKAMQDDTKKPVETRNNITNIYQKPAVGRRYAAGSDTSHGVGADYSVTAVIDVETGYVVADVCSNTIAPEGFAQESVNLLKDYNNPIWAIEDNDWGELTVTKAKELKYPRLFERRNASGQPSGKAGFRTDSRSRPILWGELIEAIRERLVIIPSKQGLSQFASVIRNPDKEGRIEGMVGTHDDYPMAVGLAWQMRKEAYRQNSKIKVITREERLKRMGNNR
jgi:hypothetical protein